MKQELGPVLERFVLLNLTQSDRNRGRSYEGPFVTHVAQYRCCSPQVSLKIV